MLTARKVCIKFASRTDFSKDTFSRRSAKFLYLLDLFGEPSRNRTWNLLIKSQLLCQLS